MIAPARTLALALVCASATGCAAKMPPSVRHPLAPAAAETKPMPEIRRRTLDGATFDSSAARGKVVVVKFFAKYCEPCKESLPWVARLAAERKDVAVVGIAEDERESDVRELAAAFGLGFPIVHDAGNALAGRFRVSELPVTFVADASGKIRWVGGPGQTEAQLRDAVSASR